MTSTLDFNETELEPLDQFCKRGSYIKNSVRSLGFCKVEQGLIPGRFVTGTHKRRGYSVMLRKNGVGDLTFGTLGYRLVYAQAGRVVLC